MTKSRKPKGERPEAARDQAQEAPGSGPRSQPQPACPWAAVPAPELDSAPQEFFWEPWIPLGSFTLLVGPSSAGKSTLLATLAADAVGGPRVTGKKKRTPGVALMLPGEEPRGLLRGRIEAAAGRLAPRIRVLTPTGERAGDVRLTFPSGLETLRQLIRSCRPRLVTLDPADSYMDDTLSENGNADVRRLLEPLQQLAEEMRCAIVGVHHGGKAEGNDILGSVAWKNVPRSILKLTPGAHDGEFLLIHAKPSGAAPARPLRYRLIPRGKGVVWATQGEAGRELEALCSPGAAAPAQRDAVEEACYLLHALLRDGPLEVPDVWSRCRAEAMSDVSFRRAKKVLGISTKRVGFGPGSKCYLHPPVKWPDWLV